MGMTKLLIALLALFAGTASGAAEEIRDLEPIVGPILGQEGYCERGWAAGLAVQLKPIGAAGVGTTRIDGGYANLYRDEDKRAIGVFAYDGTRGGELHWYIIEEGYIGEYVECTAEETICEAVGELCRRLLDP